MRLNKSVANAINILLWFFFLFRLLGQSLYLEQNKFMFEFMPHTYKKNV